MSRRLPFLGWALAFAVIAGSASGCVDRRFIIESDPLGANVYMNGKLIGPTPLDQTFTYYGKYRFVFVRDGYEWATVDEQVRAPWYEYFPLEFIAENLWPFTIRDVRYIRNPLAPRPEIPADVIHQRAQQLRADSQGLGVSIMPVDGGFVTSPPGAFTTDPVPATNYIPPAAAVPPPNLGPAMPVPVYPPGTFKQ